MGLVLGIAGIVIINLVKPTVAAAAAGNAEGGPGGMGGGPTGGGGGGMFQTQQAADIVLQAPFTPWVLVAAVGLAVLGGPRGRSIRRLARRTPQPGRGAAIRRLTDARSRITRQGDTT